MKKVFVSHANADQELVDEFVDLILRNGCDLDPSEIFYSSGADTGVPDGSDLLAFVRSQVSESGVTIALITPTFQTRPVCVAELGAAWGRTGSLFPMLVPGMARGQLEGVLSGQLVEYMDDDGPLDRLHVRITETTSRPVGAPTWTRAKRRWFARLAAIVAAGGIRTPDSVDVAEYQQAVTERDELVRALADAEDELASVRLHLKDVSALKDADEVKALGLPSAPVERFKNLVVQAREHLEGLDARVALVVVAEHSSNNGLPFPTDDQWEQQQLIDLEARGWLSEDDGVYVASDDFPVVLHAREAVELAILAVSDEGEFVDWFMSEYEARPKMTNLEILKRVLLS